MATRQVRVLGNDDELRKSKQEHAAALAQAQRLQHAAEERVRLEVSRAQELQAQWSATADALARLEASRAVEEKGATQASKEVDRVVSRLAECEAKLKVHPAPVAFVKCTRTPCVRVHACALVCTCVEYMYTKHTRRCARRKWLARPKP